LYTTMRYINRRFTYLLTYLPTKFEVSNSTHYEVMKGDTKCRKWGGLG